jgi:hypothetical protein
MFLTRFKANGDYDGFTFQAPQGGIEPGDTSQVVGAMAYDGPRNRIYVAGRTLTPTTAHDFVGAFDATTGAVITGFGGSGTGFATNRFLNATGNLHVNGVAVDPSTGDIFVAGDGINTMFAARLTPTGALRTTWGSSNSGRQQVALTGVATGRVALQNGRLLISGGATTLPHSVEQPFVAQLDPGGQWDSTWASADGTLGYPVGVKSFDFSMNGAGANSELGYFVDVAVQNGTGRIAATGWFEHTNTPGFTFIEATAVMNSDGTAYTNFNGPPGYPNPGVPGRVASEWNPTLPGGRLANVSALAWQPDGKLLITGQTSLGSSGDRNGDFGVARRLASGGLDTTFGEPAGAARTGVAAADSSNSFDQPYDIDVQPDGNIVVTGRNNNDMEVMRFVGDSPEPPQAGERVVFATDTFEPGSQLVATDINGTHGKVIRTHGTYPSLSPDGLKVAYQSSFGVGGMHIWTVNIDGSNPFDLTVASLSGCTDTTPAWSPDGARIAFARDCGSGSNIWLMNVDGSGAAQLQGTGNNNTRPVWSPDGTHLAFTRNPVPQLFTIDVSNGNETLMTNIASPVRNPGWSVKNKIAFTVDNGGGAGDTWMIDANGALNSQVLVAGGTGATGAMAWNADGTKIVMGANAHNFTGGGIIGQGIWLEPISPAESNPPAPLNITRVYAGAAFYPTVGKVAAITPSTRAISASPTSVPTSAVPLQASAPDVQLTRGSAILQLPLLNTPILQLPLLNTPILQLPLLNTPILQLPLLNTPLLQLPLLNTGLGFHELAVISDLGGSPAVQAGLRRIILSQNPILHGDDWSTRLAGTKLANKPLTSVTLADVLAITCLEDTSSNPCPAGKVKPSRLPAFGDLRLTEGPLGHLATLALMLGDTRLSQLGADANGNDTFGWCGKLEAIGYPDCGNALGVPGSSLKGRSASLISLQISGVDLDKIAGVRTLKMGDVNFRKKDANGKDTDAAYAPLPNVALRSIPMHAASMGSITLGSLPDISKIVDCSQTSCAPNLTLADVPTARIKSTAVVADLGVAANNLYLQEVALGSFTGNPADDPFNLSHDSLGILGVGGPGTSILQYHVGFAPLSSITGGKATLKLPLGFRYEMNTTSFKTNGAVVPSTEPTTTIGTDGSQTLVWNLPSPVTYAGVAVDFSARPGLRAGTTSTDPTALKITGTDVSAAYQVTASTPGVSVTPNGEAGDTVASAMQVSLDTIYFGFLDHPHDIDYFKIPAPPAGSRINVFLNNCNCDADLVLYHPTSARPHNPMRSVAPTAPVEMGLSDQAITLTKQGEPMVPEALNDIPLANLPVAGSSTNRGTNSEVVNAVAWDALPGSYYTIQVSGFNGITSPDAYDMHVSVTTPVDNLPVGDPRSFSPSGTSTAPGAATRDYHSVILTAPTRLRGAFGDARATAAINKVNELAADSSVDGLVIPVDAFDDVRAAFLQLDTATADPERANDVVRLINAHVDAILGSHRAALKSMVIVGADDILPMARVPDLTQTGNERTFAQELLNLAGANGGNDSLMGAAAAGDILSDDPYGAFTPTPFLGTYRYMPNVALGRLVESPEDMVKVITQFLTVTPGADETGELVPTNKLVTGYDFLTGMAEAIRDSLNSQITSGQMQTLINDSWTLQDLEQKFTQASTVPDIISANGHYTPTLMLPALSSAINDVTQLFVPNEFEGVDLAKRILFEIGCHSGLNISDFLANGGGTNTTDWPQQALHNGVVAMVANTGFGIAIKEPVAFSSQLYLNFADNISHMSLGQALTYAKQTYAAGLTPNVYDYKVMAEATFFGLPDFRLANTTPLPPAPPAPPTSHDNLTGLEIASVPLPGGSFTTKTTSNGSYLEYGTGNKLEIAQNRPIQPRVDTNLTQPPAAHLTAMGALITALTSNDSDLPNFNPVLARPVMDNSANEPEAQFNSMVFPATIEDTSNTLGPDGKPRQTLSVVPAQFIGAPPSSNDAAPITGVERKFTQVDSLVYYGPDSAPPAAPPVFSSVSAYKNGTSLTFDASVSDPSGAPIKRVLALWHPTGADGAWTPAEMSQGPSGNWTAPATTSATEIEYFVQALSATGAVARTTNKGDLYNSVVAPPPGTASYTVNAVTNHGWYADSATNPVKVVFHGAPSFTIEVDGVAQSPIFDGDAVTVRGDGRHTITYTSSNGSGVVSVPIDAAGPSITAVATPAPNGAGWNNTSPVTVTFTCVDGESGVATCPSPITLPSSGSQTVTATDFLGNSGTTTVTARIDAIAPTIGASPSDTATWRNAPVTVSFSCGESGGSGLTGPCPAPQTVGPNQVATASVLDVAGNSATASVGPFNIDLDAPTISASPADNTTFRNAPVTVTFTCGDTGGSGFVSCPPDQTLDKDHPVRTAVTVADVAGNETTLPAATYNFDTTPPTITPHQDPNVWRTTGFTATFDCADTGGSGVASCPDGQPVSPAQPTTTSVTVTDGAGNSTTLGPITFKFDTDAPTITYTVSPAANAAGWHKSNPTITFTCNDPGGSGVASCTAPITVKTNGTGTYEGTAVDAAGNAASVFVTIKLDKAPPTSNMNTTLGNILNLTFGAPATGTATDAPSGISKVTVAFTSILGGTTTADAHLSCNATKKSCTWTTPSPPIGVYSATVTAFDIAGNVQTTPDSILLYVSL